MMRFLGLIALWLVFQPLSSAAPANAASGSGRDSKSVETLADEIVRRAQAMLDHGNEGHTDEVILYGREMVTDAEALLNRLKKEEKGNTPAAAHLRRTLRSGQQAVQWGEKGNLPLALQAARDAAHYARIGRDELGVQ